MHRATAWGRRVAAWMHRSQPGTYSRVATCAASSGSVDGSRCRCARPSLSMDPEWPACAARSVQFCTARSVSARERPGVLPTLEACRFMQTASPRSAHAAFHSCPWSSHVSESLYQRIHDQRSPASTLTPCRRLLWRG